MSNTTHGDGAAGRSAATTDVVGRGTRRRDVALRGRARERDTNVLLSARTFRFGGFLFYFFFILFTVGRHSPSLIKSRMTLERHLVLIHATNAAESSPPPPPQYKARI